MTCHSRTVQIFRAFPLFISFHNTGIMICLFILMTRCECTANIHFCLFKDQVCYLEEPG